MCKRRLVLIAAGRAEFNIFVHVRAFITMRSGVYAGPYKWCMRSQGSSPTTLFHGMDGCGEDRNHRMESLERRMASIHPQEDIGSEQSQDQTAELFGWRSPAGSESERSLGTRGPGRMIRAGSESARARSGPAGPPSLPTDGLALPPGLGESSPPWRLALLPAAAPCSASSKVVAVLHEHGPGGVRVGPRQGPRGPLGGRVPPSVLPCLRRGRGAGFAGPAGGQGRLARGRGVVPRRRGRGAGGLPLLLGRGVVPERRGRGAGSGGGVGGDDRVGGGGGCGGGCGGGGGVGGGEFEARGREGDKVRVRSLLAGEADEEERAADAALEAEDGAAAGRARERLRAEPGVAGVWVDVGTGMDEEEFGARA